MTNIEFIYQGKPIGKPRMTQRDVWMKRPCVVQYYQFKDAIRKAAKDAGYDESMVILQIRLIAFIAIPKSWSKRRVSAVAGRAHDQKPDISNILKAVEDSLTDDDSKIFYVDAEKYWNDGIGERIEVMLTVAEEKDLLDVSPFKCLRKREIGRSW